MSEDPRADEIPPEPPEEAWLAAEYALGVGDAQARAEAGRRLERDPAFAAEVAFWQARLAPLGERIEAVAPPAHLWPRIAAGLGPHPGQGARPEGRTGLWHSLPFWRWVSAGSVGLAAACLAALAIRLERPPPPDRPPPPLVATLAPSGGRPLLSALIDRRGGSLTILPAALDASGSRVPELWLIPPGGEPRSLGPIHADRAMRIVLPPDLAPHARPDAALAVTLEPAGGSPTGKPTGPVVAHGALTEL